MPVTDLTWDSRKQRYVSPTKTLTPRETRSIIDDLVSATQKRLRDWAEQVQAGKLSIPKWQMLSAKEVKNIHTTVTVIANGGREEMTAAKWGKLGSDLKFQYRHLRDFAKEIPRRIDERTGAIAPRAEQYATSAWGTYENRVLERNKEFGLAVARRVTMHGSDSCDDCLDAEDEGWVPIDEVKEIGDSQCGARCNCTIDYEDVIPAEAEG